MFESEEKEGRSRRLVGLKALEQLRSAAAASIPEEANGEENAEKGKKTTAPVKEV